MGDGVHLRAGAGTGARGGEQAADTRSPRPYPPGLRGAGAVPAEPALVHLGPDVKHLAFDLGRHSAEFRQGHGRGELVAQIGLFGGVSSTERSGDRPAVPVLGAQEIDDVAVASRCQHPGQGVYDGEGIAHQCQAQVDQDQVETAEAVVRRVRQVFGGNSVDMNSSAGTQKAAGGPYRGLAGVNADQLGVG